MKFLNDLPLKRKLLLITLTTCTVALALACSALFWFQSVTFRKSFVAELETLGAIIARNSAAPLAFDDQKSAFEILNALIAVKPHIKSARIFDNQGKLFASIGIVPLVLGQIRALAPQGVVFSEGYATLSLPIALDETHYGRLELWALFTDQYYDLLWLYTTVLSVVVIGTFVVIFLLSSVFQRFITNPIIALSEVARNISDQEDYSSRAREFSQDEVGLLTRTFNRMLDQIQTRDARLRESQQRYERVVKHIHDALIVCNAESQIIFANDRFLDLFGIKREELPTLNLEDYFTAEWRQYLHKVYHPDSPHNDLSNQFEFEILRHDNIRFWAEINIAPVEQDGKIIGTQSTLRDITQRKQMNNVLKLLSTGLANLIGEAFFNEVACQLANLLGADIGFVGKLLTPLPRIHTLGFSIDGRVQLPMEYDLIGTPCEAVLNNEIAIFPDRVAELFPTDHLMVDQNIKGYAAVPLINLSGSAIGHIGVMSRQAFHENPQTEAILRLFAVRVAAEMERQQSEERLRKTHDRLEATLEAMPDLLFEIDHVGLIRNYRAKQAELLAAPPSTFLGKSFFEILPPDAAGVCQSAIEEAANKGVGLGKPYCLMLADGEHWFELSVARKTLAKGEDAEFIALARDITERVHAEAVVRQSLREKEVLLKEIHHRVKNNLQIISSLLHFQSQKTRNEQELAIFREAQDRLRAMILVHEQLYRSTDLHSINLGVYIQALTTQLQRSFRDVVNRIHLSVMVDRVLVTAEIALPCGMIVTELVTNAFKYAYPNNLCGPIFVKIVNRDVAFVLSVSDQGVGLPENFDLERAQSFGLQLVNKLARQLASVMRRIPGQGTTIELDIPLPTGQATPLTLLTTKQNIYSTQMHLDKDTKSP